MRRNPLSGAVCVSRIIIVARSLNYCSQRLRSNLSVLRGIARQFRWCRIKAIFPSLQNYAVILIRLLVYLSRSNYLLLTSVNNVFISRIFFKGLCECADALLIDMVLAVCRIIV